MKARETLKSFLPPIFVNGFRRLLSRDSNLKGDYFSWEDAIINSSGYDNPLILEKTCQAMLKIKTGEAAYERDSVLFDKTEYAYPLLAGLMWVAARHKGFLNVLDFGGSLGTTYFQNRLFLKDLAQVTWNIVEQEHYVDVGKQFLEDSRLKFHVSLDDCIASAEPNVAICSSSLQYVERPYDVLSKIAAAKIKCLIVDRTPFHLGDEDRLCVQQVPKEIYNASYPSWIFSHSKFILEIQKLGFTILDEFDNQDTQTGPISFFYNGMIITRFPEEFALHQTTI